MTSIRLSLRGTLKLRVDGNVIVVKNNIDPDYVALLEALLTTGAQTPYAGGMFNPVQGVAIVFVENGSVSYVLQANVIAYYDTSTSVQVEYNAKSSSSFTFNRIELWTTLNNSLYYRIAYFDFSSTINVNNFVEVSWLITATSSASYDVNYLMLTVLKVGRNLSVGGQLVESTLPQFSVVLYITALTLAPLDVLLNYNDSNFYSFYQYVSSTQLNGVGELVINPGTSSATTVQPVNACYVLQLQQGIYPVLVYYNVGGVQVPYFSQTLYVTPQPGLNVSISKYCVQANITTS